MAMTGPTRTISAIGGFHFNAAYYRLENFGRSFDFYKEAILICKN
jgi:hypothetical protein